MFVDTGIWWQVSIGNWCCLRTSNMWVRFALEIVAWSSGVRCGGRRREGESGGGGDSGKELRHVPREAAFETQSDGDCCQYQGEQCSKAKQEFRWFPVPDKPLNSNYVVCNSAQHTRQFWIQLNILGNFSRVVCLTWFVLRSLSYEVCLAKFVLRSLSCVVCLAWFVIHSLPYVVCLT
jgi:hypothetical protein